MPRIIEALDIGSNLLETPFRIIVSGGSGVGKTEFVKKVVNKEFYREPIDEIVYCYPDYLDEIPTEFDFPVSYFHGMPDLKYLSSLKSGSLLILDDMMTEVGKCENIAKLFSVIARKKNISIFLIVQNIFQRGKEFRNIRLNSTGIVLFKTRSSVSNQSLLRELEIGNLISKTSLNHALSEKYQYIFIDLHPKHQNDFGSIRGDIFSEKLLVYYTMEYVAIPKEDFYKYFKIIEADKGKIRAIKNEIKVKTKSKTSNCGSEEKRRRKRPPTPESSTSYETESE